MDHVQEGGLPLLLHGALVAAARQSGKALQEKDGLLGSTQSCWTPFATFHASIAWIAVRRLCMKDGLLVSAAQQPGVTGHVCALRIAQCLRMTLCLMEQQCLGTDLLCQADVFRWLPGHMHHHRVQQPCPDYCEDAHDNVEVGVLGSIAGDEQHQGLQVELLALHIREHLVGCQLQRAERHPVEGPVLWLAQLSCFPAGAMHLLRILQGSVAGGTTPCFCPRMFLEDMLDVMSPLLHYPIQRRYSAAWHKDSAFRQQMMCVTCCGPWLAETSPAQSRLGWRGRGPPG